MQTERLMAMVTIVGRGDGVALSRLYAQNGVALHIQVAAGGTASSELLSLLGLTHRERDLLLSFAPESSVDALMSRLDDDYRGVLRARGIAFSLKLTGVSAAVAAALAPSAEVKGGSAMHSDKEFNLILVVVNQGYTDEVMQTACKAGATGGTVIRGRWVGAERLEQFHGIALQDEKEILAIACLRDSRAAIMDAIVAAHGLGTDRQAIVCSLPIDRMVRLA